MRCRYRTRRISLIIFYYNVGWYWLYVGVYAVLDGIFSPIRACHDILPRFADLVLVYGLDVRRCFWTDTYFPRWLQTRDCRIPAVRDGEDDV